MVAAKYRPTKGKTDTTCAKRRISKNKQVLTAEYKQTVTNSGTFRFQVNTGTQEKYRGRTAKIFAASSVSK
ncbi:hypothetical protein EHR01_14635 [Leptospira mtsangambouensis]|uniref:Uncharacterized protein n=1 Tax=Leptospira mtsangambouensis TaxID=2484912 RepID=A0ABY2NVZ8_9LEPT|nr:hypothetical protein [Leptospira mtsangambouensis]TGM72483.1 hypothetical protein EHR01_14635 [Leptospira mtsangambouensis]